MSDEAKAIDLSKPITRDNNIKEWDDTYLGKWYKVTFKERKDVEGLPYAIVQENVAVAYARKLYAFNNRKINHCDVVSVEEVEKPKEKPKKEGQKPNSQETAGDNK